MRKIGVNLRGSCRSCSKSFDVSKLLSEFWSKACSKNPHERRTWWEICLYQPWDCNAEGVCQF